MKDIKRGKQSTIRFDEITYECAMAPGDFSERLLKNPPREYTR